MAPHFYTSWRTAMRSRLWPGPRCHSSAHLQPCLLTAGPARCHRRNLAVSAASQQQAAGSKLEGRPLDRYIGPGLRLMEQQYDLAGHVLRMVAPIDVDAVMDMYIDAGVDGDPYWTRVWPSALALAQQLLSRPELVASCKVADLGAGLGVAGIAAALAGAKEVVLLDREPLALQCALEAAAASGVHQVQPWEPQPGGPQTSSTTTSSSSSSRSGAPDTPSSTTTSSSSASDINNRGSADTVPAEQHSSTLQSCGEPQASSLADYNGGDGGTSSSSSSKDVQQNHHSSGAHPTAAKQPPQQHSPSSSSSSSQAVAGSSPLMRAQLFDWHQTQLSEKFDVVVACDVLYEESAVEPIARVVPQLLKSTSGLLILADPPNRTAHNRERCIRLLAEAQPAGLQLQECGVVQCEVAKLDPEMAGGVDRETVPIQFMVFRRVLGNDTVGVKLDWQ